MGERLVAKIIRGIEQAHKCLCRRVPPESTDTHTHALTSQPREGEKAWVRQGQNKYLRYLNCILFYT